jgi:hypothetical protein
VAMDKINKSLSQDIFNEEAWKIYDLKDLRFTMYVPIGSVFSNQSLPIST